MLRFGKLKLQSERGGTAGTTVYGWICEGGLIEAFATNPSASGTSSAMLGKFHRNLWNVESITQKHFNTAFLIWVSEDEMKDEDCTLSLGELMTKYPLED